MNLLIPGRDLGNQDQLNEILGRSPSNLDPKSGSQLVQHTDATQKLMPTNAKSRGCVRSTLCPQHLLMWTNLKGNFKLQPYKP